MKTIITSCLVILMLSLSVVTAEETEHESAIKQAVLDYVDAIYEMKPELITKSVSPKVQKVGYMPKKDGSGLEEGWMTFQQLKDLAASINKEGMFDPQTSPKEVQIVDHTDMIANVKLTAGWGMDYIHLTRHSGEWMIINVIWEMPSE